MNVVFHELKPARRALTIVAWVALAATPFILLAIVSLAVGHNAWQSNPVWTDELDYWRGVFSWLHMGGQTGYNGIGEQTALLGTLSVHGVTPILLYGWYALLFGWDFSSIVMANALLISLGAVVFIALNRPKARTSLTMALALMAYAPVVLYCATSMTELANYGLLLFYLAFVTRLWNVRRAAGIHPPVTKGLPSLILACLTVLVCCTYRITYAVLWLPLIIVACDAEFSGKMGLSFLAALLGTLFIYYISALLACPFTSGFLYNFLRAGSAEMALRMFLSHAKANLLDYFVNQPASVMEGLQRWLYCGVMALTLILSFVRADRSQGRLRLRLGLDGFTLAAFAMLFIPFAIVVCAYETNDWSDYRTLAPFLWLVVSACLIRGRRLAPALYLAGCAAILAVLLTGAPVGAYSDDARFVTKPFTTETQELCAAVAYDPSATDPFVNTVRTDLFNLQTVAMLHPGIGLETGWFTADTVGKSRWILTDHLKIPLEGYEQVYKNAIGSVYRQTSAEAQ